MNDVRRDRQDHLGGDPLGYNGTQQIADEREIADPWDGGAGFLILFLEQPSQYDSFAISDIEHGFRRPIAELKLGNRGIGLERNEIAKTNDFDLHLE